MCFSSGATKELTLDVFGRQLHTRIGHAVLSRAQTFRELGAVVCLIVVRVGMSALLKWLPQWLARLNEVSLSPTVLAFTAIASLLTALVFGILPALVQTSHLDLSTAFKSGNRWATSSPRKAAAAQCVRRAAALDGRSSSSRAQES